MGVQVVLHQDGLFCRFWLLAEVVLGLQVLIIDTVAVSVATSLRDQICSEINSVMHDLPYRIKMVDDATDKKYGE